MNRVAKSVLERGNMGRNAPVRRSSIVGRNDHVRSKSAVDIHPENLCIDAHVPLTAQALTAMAADDVRLAGNEFANMAALHSFANLHDRSAEFMADDAGWLNARTDQGSH